MDAMRCQATEPVSEFGDFATGKGVSGHAPGCRAASRWVDESKEPRGCG